MRFSRRSARTFILAAVGLYVHPGMALSQAANEAPEPELIWSLAGLRESSCIEFFMDSASAARQINKVSDGYQPLRADRFALLSPVLRGVIGRQPEYSAWIPSTVCIFGSDSVSLDGRVLTDSDASKRQMVGFWGIAALALSGPSAESTYVAPVVFTSNYRVGRTSDLHGIEVRTIKELIEPVEESDKTRYETEVLDAMIRWDGKLVSGDPEKAQPWEGNFVVAGKRSQRFRVRVTVTPALSQVSIGSLLVQGKSDLAKALQGSPIRMYGPVFWGGKGSMSFYRR